VVRSLIRERRPVAVFGEQVASKADSLGSTLFTLTWKAAGYTVGAVDLCAAGVGAPHIRQRLFFVADAGKARPVEPGTFPLAHGVAARVGRLRAYGNAIVPQLRDRRDPSVT
jgi:site-specific DNA-cytosine methylase